VSTFKHHLKTFFLSLLEHSARLRCFTKTRYTSSLSFISCLGLQWWTTNKSRQNQSQRVRHRAFNAHWCRSLRKLTAAQQLQQLTTASSRHLQHSASRTVLAASNKRPFWTCRKRSVNFVDWKRKLIPLIVIIKKPKQVWSIWCVTVGGKFCWRRSGDRARSSRCV